jgi:hypothetical protein
MPLVAEGGDPSEAIAVALVMGAGGIEKYVSGIFCGSTLS